MLQAAVPIGLPSARLSCTQRITVAGRLLWVLIVTPVAFLRLNQPALPELKTPVAPSSHEIHTTFAWVLLRSCVESGVPPYAVPPTPPWNTTVFAASPSAE